MPQPRSSTEAGWAIATRAARCSATRSRVACSRPSGVKYIRPARCLAELGDRAVAQLDLGEGGGGGLAGDAVRALA